MPSFTSDLETADVFIDAARRFRMLRIERAGWFCRAREICVIALSRDRNLPDKNEPCGRSSPQFLQLETQKK
jgi:hypothetical protein